jgi:hypothetical protein
MQKVKPEPSSLELEHRRQRRRTKRKTFGAFAVTAAIGMAAVASSILAALGGQNPTKPTDQTPTPAPATPQGAQWGSPAFDPFVSKINSCKRLLVTREQVESELGFRAEESAPWKPAASYGTHSKAEVESWGGVVFGCEYASHNNFASALNKEKAGGQVVISAYRPEAPPSPLGRSQRVQGLGDEAEFSPFGNGDEHVVGPEGATSILEVRSGGYLILRFNAGVFDAPHGIGADLPALQQLAEDALTTLDEGASANGATLDADPARKSCGDFRIAPPGQYPALRVEVVAGNLPCRVARRLMKAHYHGRDTGAWSCHGPEGFAGCEKKTGEAIRARFYCRDWGTDRARCRNTFGS